ncbi:MAG: hypothetical protein WB663_14090 [Beijerinckiaceae bacterium]|jgi:hypothetical protein
MWPDRIVVAAPALDDSAGPKTIEPQCEAVHGAVLSFGSSDLLDEDSHNVAFLLVAFDAICGWLQELLGISGKLFWLGSRYAKGGLPISRSSDA